jgi:hypothetical protein
VDVWQVTKQAHDPIPLPFSPDGYLRFSTRPLTIGNSRVFTQAVSLLPSKGILMYRLRMNMSGGSEAKVAIFEGYTLHITDSGRRLEWDIYNSHGHFVNQRDIAIIVGSREWILVSACLLADVRHAVGEWHGEFFW